MTGEELAALLRLRHASKADLARVLCVRTSAVNTWWSSGVPRVRVAQVRSWLAPGSLLPRGAEPAPAPEHPAWLSNRLSETGVNQAEVASAMGVGRGTVSRWKASGVPVSRLVALQKALADDSPLVTAACRRRSAKARVGKVLRRAVDQSSVEKVATTLGVERPKISDWLRKGVPFARRYKVEAMLARDEDLDLGAYVDGLRSADWLHERMLTTGITITRLGAEVHVDHSSVRKWLVTGVTVGHRSQVESVFEDDSPATMAANAQRRADEYARFAAIDLHAWLQARLAETGVQPAEFAAAMGLTEATMVSWNCHGVPQHWEGQLRVALRHDSPLVRAARRRHATQGAYRWREVMKSAHQRHADVARALGVKPATVGLWLRQGVPASRRAAFREFLDSAHLANAQERLSAAPPSALTIREVKAQQRAAVKAAADKASADKRAADKVAADKASADERARFKPIAVADLVTLMSESGFDDTHVAEALNVSEAKVAGWRKRGVPGGWAPSVRRLGVEGVAVVVRADFADSDQVRAMLKHVAERAERIEELVGARDGDGQRWAEGGVPIPLRSRVKRRLIAVAVELFAGDEPAAET